MPVGGFDLGAGMSNAMQLMQQLEAMKQHKLQRENPLPKALEDAALLQQKMGESYNIGDNPEAMAQLQRLHRMTPEQGMQFQETLKNTPSPARQRRVLDLKTHLMEMNNKLAEVRQKNMMTMQMFNKADPEMAKMMENALRQSEQDLLQSYRRNLELGYSDVWQTPEVQDMMKRAVIEGIMGPSSTGGMPQGPMPQGPMSGAPQPMVTSPMPPPQLSGGGVPDYPRPQAGSLQSPFWQSVGKQRGGSR